MKTPQEAFDNFHNAVVDLFWAIAKAWHLPQIVEWLNKVLSKLD